MLNKECLICGRKHRSWNTIIKCFKKHPTEVDWYHISAHQILSEEFIREFQDKVDWYLISKCQTLSVGFIREFQHEVTWHIISESQALSEGFIKEFQDKVNWKRISKYQVLSEEFIREFQDKVDWDRISRLQNLSEGFIREFQDKVNWYLISTSQTLSGGFLKEFQDKVNWDRISEYQFSYQERTFNPTNLQDYAEKQELKIKDGYLYAFRNHDKRGRGKYNYNRTYQVGIYYEDWHCDLNPNHENSYGFGIWPKGNTPIRVKLEDWGTEVIRDSDGKARVKGFEII